MSGPEGYQASDFSSWGKESTLILTGWRIGPT